jgi:hypothetical protein
MDLFGVMAPDFRSVAALDHFDHFHESDLSLAGWFFAYNCFLISGVISTGR